MTRLPRLAVPLAALAGMALITAPAVPAALGSTTTTAVQTADIPDNLDPSKTEAFSSAVNGLEDLDRRAAAVAPTALQKQLAGALKATVRWNRYGTPGSILPDDGLIAGRNGSAVETAKGWLKRNADLFGGTAVVNSLELINDSKMTRGSTGHAVLFRQQFGQLTSAVDGMVTLGVNDRGVVYVSSSLSKATATPAAASLTPQQAWVAAAGNVGIARALDAISGVTQDADTGFTTFKVTGMAQEQQVRLRALAVSNSSVRPVYETNVVNSAGGEATAYTSFVDAVSGKVLVRHNQVDNFAGGMGMTNSTEPFAGAITPTACGPAHGPYAVDDQTKTITVGVNAALPDTDIIINLRFGAPNGPIVASEDLLFSPEALVYSPPGGVPAGDYYAEVCPFEKGQAQESGEYIGVFSASEESLSAPEQSQPAWKMFLANPKLDFSAKEGAGPRATMCWVQFNVADDVSCQTRHMLNNPAARLPWDVNPFTFLPTNTTTGNAAITAEAWFSPLTPGGGQRPLQPDRTYNDTFTDSWNNNKCSQVAFTPEPGNSNDILAATTNLFAGHNRFHDFSWYLGFTEDNYNMQQTNFGNLGLGGDPEVGNVQAGALTGGQPSFLGRDNANQITLQDGVPGITNQYLFQPIAAAFYSPCVDGDLDATVFGHEYTHAISNRMVAGPDAGLSGFQAGSMGESWSDQVALEYLFANGYDIGTNPWVLGAYVTGNRETGIRNYPLNKNPLQYGDVGYDSPGAEVHSDGEVWSAAMWDVRQALVNKYNADFRYTNEKLQKRCAEGFRGTRSPHGPLPPYKCPGNNRWIALMFDSFLLQQSSTSMLDARNAYLAADLLRFHGKNHKVIWDAFASDGFGKDARTDGTEDDQPIPGYASPLSKEGTVTVRAVDARSGKAVNGQLLVSKYDARVTPVADTSRKTRLGNSVDMVPGTYPMLFRAKGYGITTSQMSVRAGDTTAIRLTLKPNLASKFKGAKIAGTTGAGDPDASRNPDALIDDTQGSNWGVKTAENVDKSQPVINVDLAGGVHKIRKVKVSAFLRPAGGDTSDNDSGSRFTALRQFAIEVCIARSSGACTGTGDNGYKLIFTSSPNAFNSVKPRPLAPTLLLKSFDVPNVNATHVRLVVLDNQCTGYKGYQGDQDDDLLNDTGCATSIDSDRGTIAHAAELQVFD